MYSDDFDGLATDESCLEDSSEDSLNDDKFDTTNSALDDMPVQVLPEPEHDRAWKVSDFQSLLYGPVPNLFDRGTVNLLVGSLAAGKTILALSQFNSYYTEGTFLGYQKPKDEPRAQCAAIIASKGLEAFYKLLRGLPLNALLDPVGFPIQEWEPQAGETLLETLTRLWKAMSCSARRPVQFLYIEGFQSLLESGKINDPRSIQEFYRTLRQFCSHYRVTILGSVPQGKTRKGEVYASLGDRAYGAVAWVAEASTIIGIEQLMLHMPSELRPHMRKITIQAQGQPVAVTWADFNSLGQLEIVDRAKELQTENPTFAKLDLLLANVPTGQVWSRDELQEWVEKNKIEIGDRTLDRWIASRSDAAVGLLEKIGGTRRAKGYRKPFFN